MGSSINALEATKCPLQRAFDIDAARIALECPRQPELVEKTTPTSPHGSEVERAEWPRHADVDIACQSIRRATDFDASDAEPLVNAGTVIQITGNAVYRWPEEFP